MPKKQNKNTGRARPQKRVPRQPKSLVDKLRAISIGDAFDAALSAVNTVSNLVAVNTEVKYLDNGLGQVAQTWTGVVSPISYCAEGLTDITRVGESIRTHGMEFRYTMFSAAATQNACRFIVFADSQQQGVLPTPGDVLEQSGTGLSPYSPWDHDNNGRFIVLYDSGPKALSPGGNGTIDHSGVIPINHHIRYSGAAGTVAEAREGNLYVLTISDVAASGPTCAWFTRVYYVDN